MATTSHGSYMYCDIPSISQRFLSCATVLNITAQVGNFRLVAGSLKFSDHHESLWAQTTQLHLAIAIVVAVH